MGVPDFANVRRHFYARTVESQSFTLGANQLRSFVVTADDMGDCAMVRIIADPGVCVLIDTYGVSGDFAEQWKMMSTQPWGKAHRIPLSPYGGGFDILVQDTTGVGGKAVSFDVEQYVGITARELGPFQRTQSSGAVLLAPGALLPAPLTFPDGMYYDRMSVWAMSDSSNTTVVFSAITNGDIDSTAGSMTDNEIILQLSGVSFSQVFDYPTPGPFYVTMQNIDGAVSHTSSLYVRCYKDS